MNNKGQGLLEFALVILILFIVIFGVMVLAQIFQVKVVLNNAAREGVRYLSIHPMDNIGSFSGTKAAALAEAQNSGVELTSSDVLTSCSIDAGTGFCASGYPVEVRVIKNYTLAWEWLFPNAVLLEGAAQMVTQ